jgi:hypothetical protein
MTGRTMRIALALAISGGALVMDEDVTQGLSLSSAQAVIGRPLTPMSYAGVARRTTRRAAYAGAYAGAATAYAYSAPPVYAAPPPAYGGNCVQVVDAYGQVTTRC